jgi:HTH-type transcriptional repressor of NAD biosynthesis genes
MERGLVVGKFLPPHLGHKYLIESAASQCDQLTVMVCDRPEYGIPINVRTGWLSAIHPEVEVISIRDTLDDNDSRGWAAATIARLGYRPDVVFSSENYGPGYAGHMGSRHVMVDKARHTVPISGTEVRADPWAAWQYLHEIVRAYFVRRVCVVGAESSGTTTLTKALAEHYHTTWVPEYGRTYTIEQQARLAREGWKTDDFVQIACEQNRQEDEAARAANKLLFCDTDSFATSIWHERYMKRRSPEVEAVAAGRKYALYLLTDTHIPFEDDGTRDGKAYREWMQDRFEEKLRFWSKPYVMIKGTPEERLQQAVGLIDQIIENRAITLPGLQRNNWQPTADF